jgi:hypothetical protein
MLCLDKRLLAFIDRRDTDLSLLFIEVLRSPESHHLRAFAPSREHFYFRRPRLARNADAAL